MTEVFNKDVVVSQYMSSLPDQGIKYGMCLEEIARHGNYKQDKNILKSKIKTSCTKRRYTVCQKHFVITLR